MLLRYILVAVLATCVASRVLDVSVASSRSDGRKVTFRRDDPAQGFEGSDQASDADWQKFTAKGGALVRSWSG